MKIILFLFLTFFLFSCSEEKVKTYQEAIDHCNKVLELGEAPFPSAQCTEGFHIPEFTATTNTGEQIDAEALMGKPSVINLWFVGCPPCEAETPGLESLYVKYKDKVNFIAIGRNSKDRLDKFLETHQWNFVHINDPGSRLCKGAFQQMWGYPTTFVVNEDGVIAKAFSGGKVDDTAVEYIINEIEPTLISLLAE